MLSFDDTEKAFDSSIAAVRTTRDVVVVDGPEAAAYLQGQVSQNVERLEIGQSAWTLLLEPQGRITAWARVTRTADEVFWLDTDAGFGEAMLARLERFKLRTKASFELFTASVVSVRGPGAMSFDPLDVGDLPEGAVVATLGWPGVTGVDLLGRSSLSLFGLDEGSPDALEALRIRAGIPSMGRELGEKTIPAETGVVNRSTDFTKGCYVGQELVARIDSRGNNTPRTVLPLEIDATDPPGPGAAVFIDGAQVGTITSAARSGGAVIALASVKRGVVVPAVAKVDLAGAQADARISPANWA